MNKLEKEIIKRLKRYKKPVDIQTLALKMGKAKVRQVIDIDQEFKEELWHMAAGNLLDFDSKWNISLAKTKDA